MSTSSDRRNFVKGLGLGAAWLAMPSLSACNTPGRRRPNIVVFMADDLGFGDLGCYGHPFARTPHIDGLARDGIKFEAFYSAGPNCSPSRAGILTGRHPFRTGIYDWIPKGEEVSLPRKEISIARWLRDHGYATCFVGKWHLSGHLFSKTQTNPGDHGFDHWLATQNNASPRIGPHNFVRNGRNAKDLRDTVVRETAAHTVVHEAIRWIEAREASNDPDAPFCLFVWFHEPHHPFVSTREFMAPYAEYGPQLASYYGSISHMDDAVGDLLAVLDDTNRASDSFVLFTSDNGPNAGVGSPAMFRDHKGSTFEGGIRIPGIARWPGRIPPGSVSNVPVIATDLFPTVCEAAEIPTPRDRVLDGRSFIPTFSNGEIARDRPYFWYHPLHLYAIRDGDWKLLAEPDYSGAVLFNIVSDPEEQRNLAGQEPERVKRLLAELRAMRDEVRAEGPTWEGWPAGDRRQKRNAGTT